MSSGRTAAHKQQVLFRLVWILAAFKKSGFCHLVSRKGGEVFRCAWASASSSVPSNFVPLSLKSSRIIAVLTRLFQNLLIAEHSFA